MTEYVRTAGYKRENREGRLLGPADVRIRRAESDINLAAAFLLTAEEYSRFCIRLDDPLVKGKPDFSDLELRNNRYRDLILNNLEKICFDTYGKDQNTQNLIAEPNTGTSGPQETYGACRLVYGDALRKNFIEAAELFQLDSIQLPHQRDGLSDYEIAELGRVVVSPEQRPHNTRVIIGGLMDGVCGELRERKIKGLYITLPTRSPARLLTHIQGLGYKLELVDGVEFGNSESAIEIREQFPVYWEDMEPALFYLRTPNRFLDFRRRRLLKKKINGQKVREARNAA